MSEKKIYTVTLTQSQAEYISKYFRERGWEELSYELRTQLAARPETLAWDATLDLVSALREIAGHKLYPEKDYTEMKYIAIDALVKAGLR